MLNEPGLLTRGRRLKALSTCALAKLGNSFFLTSLALSIVLEDVRRVVKLVVRDTYCDKKCGDNILEQELAVRGEVFVERYGNLQRVSPKEHGWMYEPNIPLEHSPNPSSTCKPQDT